MSLEGRAGMNSPKKGKVLQSKGCVCESQGCENAKYAQGTNQGESLAPRSIRGSWLLSASHTPLENLLVPPQTWAHVHATQKGAPRRRVLYIGKLSCADAPTGPEKARATATANCCPSNILYLGLSPSDWKLTSLADALYFHVKADCKRRQLGEGLTTAVSLEGHGLPEKLQVFSLGQLGFLTELQCPAASPAQT